MLEYLTVHTKVRRLGYLKLLVAQYFDKDFIPINSFSQFFEKVAGAVEIQMQLQRYAKNYYKDDKGLIENLMTGGSAEPYTKLALDLSIIASSNYSYILTKYGKVYKVVSERYNKEPQKFKFIEQRKSISPELDLFEDHLKKQNTFLLNELDKFFFMKQIIEKDLLYIKAITALIENNSSTKKQSSIRYSFVKEGLLNQVRLQLEEYQKSPSCTLAERAKAVTLLKKFNSKELKVRSYESIVEPRVNWMLDLDLLDNRKFRQGILQLSKAGNVFHEKLSRVYDTHAFLESEFVKTFAAIYDLEPKIQRSPEKCIEKYLDYSFQNFKTLAPNRISASQAFSYISMMCLLREGFFVEYKEVKNYIFTIDGKGYTIDWFPSENDGSIKKQKDD
jgi:hypothetical protein